MEGDKLISLSKGWVLYETPESIHCYICMDCNKKMQKTSSGAEYVNALSILHDHLIYRVTKRIGVRLVHPHRDVIPGFYYRTFPEEPYLLMGGGTVGEP